MEFNEGVKVMAVSVNYALPKVFRASHYRTGSTITQFRNVILSRGSVRYHINYRSHYTDGSAAKGLIG